MNMLNNDQLESNNVYTQILLKEYLHLLSHQRNIFIQDILNVFNEWLNISSLFTLENLPKCVERKNGKLKYTKELLESQEKKTTNIVRNKVNANDSLLKHCYFICLYGELIKNEQDGIFFDLEIYKTRTIKIKKNFYNNLLNKEKDTQKTINEMDKEMYQIVFIYEEMIFDIWKEYMLLESLNRNIQKNMNQKNQLELKYIPILSKKKNETLMIFLTMKELKFSKYQINTNEVNKSILYNVIKTFKNIVFHSSIYEKIYNINKKKLKYEIK